MLCFQPPVLEGGSGLYVGAGAWDARGYHGREGWILMCDPPPTLPKQGDCSLSQFLPLGTLRGGTSGVCHSLRPFGLCQTNTGDPFCNFSGTSHCPSSCCAL